MKHEFKLLLNIGGYLRVLKVSAKTLEAAMMKLRNGCPYSVTLIKDLSQ